MKDAEFLERRDRLVGLVTEAAEIEHALCCAYLYAAFSMKTEPDSCADDRQVERIRGWKTTLLKIARQEMAHLALVNNVVMALGEAPYFRRPNFPVTREYWPLDTALELLPFGLKGLVTFVAMEMPENDVPVQALEKSLVDETGGELGDTLGKFRVSAFRGVGSLYVEIKETLERLGDIAPRQLFLGPERSQVDQRALFPGYPPENLLSGLRRYDISVEKVSGVESAMRAIKQIREEGEGSVTGEFGHFQLLTEIIAGLNDELKSSPNFEPSRDVVANPYRAARSGVTLRKMADSGTKLTHPLALEATATFDLAYEVLLRMLILFFAQNTVSREGYDALQSVAFFPMMTLVIRPLGEIVSHLPAFESDPEGPRAGVTFDCPRRVQFLPHMPSAWQILYGQLVQLRDRVERLSKHPDVPQTLVKRIEHMYENCWRIADNFRKSIP